MSWTKRQLVEEAFIEIGIAPYVFDASAEQYQTALRRLDAMVSAWEIDGIRLRYPLPSDPSQSSLDDKSFIPDWANQAVYTNLAINLAPSYGKVVSNDTKQLAKSGYQKLWVKFTSPPQMQLPGEMPAGAGNKPWRLTNDPFLYDPVDNIDLATDSTLQFNG